ncbi:MAG TPA: DUF4351 domain-containing protein [Polyangiaceae bacterium]|nr:DUF4351 domain-containing protein [Polyangiaceae bacterium]
MLSMRHECLVDLFKNRPSLGAELLSEALGVALPSYSEARLISIDLTEIRPAEYRADVVVLLLDGDIPIWVLIVEVQLGIDPRKRFTWPDYTMGARAAHRCPVGLLVVAPDPVVAAWCAEPIETGIPGFVLHPPVLGREAILPAIGTLDDEKARFYGDLVLSCLNEAARKSLEAMMKGYEYQSDFAKKYVAQGRQEGRKEGEFNLLLRQLRARFGELPAAVVTRIEAADIDELERWGERVLSARTLAEVLDEPS